MLKSLVCFIFIAGAPSRIIFISRIFFLAKPLRPYIPLRSLGALCAFARGRNIMRAILSSCGNLSRQAAKIAKRIIPKEF